MANDIEVSRERFSRFTPRDAALTRWRYGCGYVALLAERRYRRMFAGARRLLDIGCGLGAAAQWAGPADYFGVDLSETLIRQGTAHPDRHLATADVWCLPFPDGAFDRVVCMGVLHHLPREDLAATLQEMARVLEPGGEIAIMEPNPWSLYQRLLAYLRPAERGILHTSPRRLRRAIETVHQLSIVQFGFDHTMFWPAHLTFLLSRWSWVTGPRVTAFLMTLHRFVVGLTPRWLRSHTSWRLRKAG